MDIGALQNLISSVGFPIFVAVWMLYKTSKDSESLKDTIATLNNSITELTIYIKKGEDNGSVRDTEGN